MSQERSMLRGKAGPIRIERTEKGIAQITAEDADDALLGLGYCHGRDRGLQMRLVRIFGRGQACERLRDSDAMLEIDRFFRRLNFCGDAAEQTAALTPRVQQGNEAYGYGVNLAFEELGVPWELRVLGGTSRDDPWTFADVYLMAKVIGYVALAISQNEIERWIIECVQGGISRALLEELFPGQLEGLDEEAMRRVQLQERVVPEALWQVPGLPAAMASNNWVVAGSKTASGRPIVCNDPHLQVNRLPAFWYEAVLRWTSNGAPRYAMGASVPGIPGIIVGRNPDVAWTVTYAFMDCVDSWIEDCREGRYRRGQDWIPFRIREETIQRRRNPPLVIRFHENDHGTLNGDPHTPGSYLTTRWSCGEQTGAMSLEAVLGMFEARTLDEGRAHLGHLCNSSWNWLLADRDGNIGYQMAGKMPLRRPGTSGLVPLPGWEPDNDWRGFAAIEDLPQCLNPPEGFLATANDDLNRYGKLKPINLCVAPYRAERIRAELSRPGPFTLEDMKTLQFDVHSTQAERFMAILRPLLDAADPGENRQILLDWDLGYHDDSRGAYLFEQLYRELLQEVFGGQNVTKHPRTHLGVPVVNHLLDETTLMAEYYGAFDAVLLSEHSLWFGGRPRDEIYATVLARILRLEPRPYGESRQMRLEHLVLGSKLPTILGFDRGPIPLKGGRATVHQGQWLRAQGRRIACGPSYRFVTDLATDEMQTTLPGGPSDRRFSPWYVNGLLDWLTGNYTVLRGRNQEETKAT